MSKKIKKNDVKIELTELTEDQEELLAIDYVPELVFPLKPSDVTYKGDNVYFEGVPNYIKEVCFLVVKNNKIYNSGENEYNMDLGQLENYLGNNFPCAFIYKVKGEEKVFCQADGVSTEMDEYIGDRKGKTSISLTCFAELTGIKGKNILKNIDNRNIKIIDATTDEEITKDKQFAKLKGKTLEKAKEIAISPRNGFTLIEKGKSFCWHSSASCLFTYNKKHFLVGQDEGTYFGVELPKKVNSIKDAFESLVPKEAKGKKYQRQGEWFVISVEEKDLPKNKQFVELDDMDLNLSIDDPGSNYHNVKAKKYLIGTDALYAYKGDMEHDEHKRIEFKGWVKFIKNTAVRSVSVGGVD